MFWLRNKKIIFDYTVMVFITVHMCKVSLLDSWRYHRYIISATIKQCQVRKPICKMKVKSKGVHKNGECFEHSFLYFMKSLFDLIFYVPVNNFLVMSGRVFLG